ncbi:hypothetical protein SOPP22_17850 [Shewanella sp. OPT22]|nr:hypothetical protein SOPP22_17850 [Shewanella sp. OPT22]
MTELAVLVFRPATSRTAPCSLDELPQLREGETCSFQVENLCYSVKLTNGVITVSEALGGFHSAPQPSPTSGVQLTQYLCKILNSDKVDEQTRYQTLNENPQALEYELSHCSVEQCKSILNALDALISNMPPQELEESVVAPKGTVKLKPMNKNVPSLPITETSLARIAQHSIENFIAIVESIPKEQQVSLTERVFQKLSKAELDPIEKLKLTAVVPVDYQEQIFPSDYNFEQLFKNKETHKTILTAPLAWQGLRKNSIAYSTWKRVTTKDPIQYLDVLNDIPAETQLDYDQFQPLLALMSLIKDRSSKDYTIKILDSLSACALNALTKCPIEYKDHISSAFLKSLILSAPSNTCALVSALGDSFPEAESLDLTQPYIEACKEANETQLTELLDVINICCKSEEQKQKLVDEVIASNSVAGLRIYAKLHPELTTLLKPVNSENINEILSNLTSESIKQLMMHPKCITTAFFKNLIINDPNELPFKLSELKFTGNDQLDLTQALIDALIDSNEPHQSKILSALNYYCKTLGQRLHLFKTIYAKNPELGIKVYGNLTLMRMEIQPYLQFVWNNPQASIENFSSLLSRVVPHEALMLAKHVTSRNTITTQQIPDHMEYCLLLLSNLKTRYRQNNPNYHLLTQELAENINKLLNSKRPLTPNTKKELMNWLVALSHFRPAVISTALEHVDGSPLIDIICHSHWQTPFSQELHSLGEKNSLAARKTCFRLLSTVQQQQIIEKLISSGASDDAMELLEYVASTDTKLAKREEALLKPLISGLSDAAINTINGHELRSKLIKLGHPHLKDIFSKLGIPLSSTLLLATPFNELGTFIASEACSLEMLKELKKKNTEQISPEVNAHILTDIAMSTPPCVMNQLQAFISDMSEVQIKDALLKVEPRPIARLYKASPIPDVIHQLILKTPELRAAFTEFAKINYLLESPEGNLEKAKELLRTLTSTNSVPQKTLTELLKQASFSMYYINRRDTFEHVKAKYRVQLELLKNALPHAPKEDTLAALMGITVDDIFDVLASKICNEEALSVLAKDEGKANEFLANFKADLMLRTELENCKEQKLLHLEAIERKLSECK